MRLRTAKYYLAGVTLGAIAAVVTAIFLIADFNAYRAEIAAAIEAETGREVEFGGDIVLKLGQTSALTVNDVRLANLPGGSSSDMLKAAEASAEVSIWPLLRGDIVIQRLVLRGAEINIDIDERGGTNFDFMSATPDGLARAESEDAKFSLARVGNIDIRDSTVTIRDARSRETQKLTLQRLRMRDADLETLMHVETAGKLESGGESFPFDLEGRVGNIAALVAQDEPYPVELRGSVAGITAIAAGTIADPFAATGLVLRVDLSGDDLPLFEPFIGDGLPSAGPVRLVASLNGTAERFALDDLSLAIDDSRVSGDLVIDLSDKLTDLEGRLTASRLNITPWLEADDDATSDREDRLLDNQLLPFETLREVNARLSIVAETLIASDLVFRKAALEFDLRNGNLDVSSASAKFDGRAVSGGLSVNARVSPPAVAFNLTARDFDVGRSLARIFDDQFINGVGGIDFSIVGRGLSLAEIVGSSTGHARVLMDGGEVRTGSLGLLVGGVSEMFQGAGTGDADWTAINCVAGDFDLRNGVATSRVALLDSELLRLVGDGQIDLSQDTIKFHVAPSAKNPTLNVSVPVDLRGPVANPTISPDEFSVLRRLGGLVGAVVFPPAALLSLGSLGSQDNPCLQAVQSAEAPVVEEPPVDWNAQTEAETPPEPGKDVEDRLIDAVKQLLPLRGNGS